MIDFAEIEYSNPRHNPAGGIDVDINHPVHGWIPYTCSGEEAEGIALLARITADAASIAPFVPNEASTNPADYPLNRFQFEGMLLAMG